MAIPEYLVTLKQRAFEKGWLLEVIPFGVGLTGSDSTRIDHALACTDRNRASVLRYKRYHTEADESVLGELCAETRRLVDAAAKRNSRQAKMARERGERRSKARMKRA